MQRLQREIKLEELKQKNGSRVWILDSAAALNCVDEGLFDNGTNPLTDLTVATLTGLQDVSVVGDLHIAWETATGGAFVDVLRQVVGIPNCSSNILSMGLLRAQGAYFSINDNSQEMYMRLPGNDMKFPITIADDNTFVMRLEVLPTPEIQQVSVVPSRPGGEAPVASVCPPQVGIPYPRYNFPYVSVVELPRNRPSRVVTGSNGEDVELPGDAIFQMSLPFVESIRTTKDMTKFLCQRTEWDGHRNIKLYYPPPVSCAELECDDALVVTKLDEGQSNEPKDNSKGVEYCNLLQDMTEQNLT